MKRQLLTLLSCVILYSVLTSQLAVAGDVARVSKLKLMDVFELEYAADPRIAPDGNRVAYLRTGMNIMTDRRQSKLWIVNVDGSAHRPLVAPDDGSISHPRWSPDGSRIAYVTKAAEHGPAQIYCLWAETGQTVRLTQLPDGPGHLTWSPDGQSISFTMLVEQKAEPFVKLPTAPKGAKWADPPIVIRKVLYRSDGNGYVIDGFRHVFVVPAEGGTPKQLTSGNFHHNGPLSWSADGDSVLFSANRNSNWEYEPRESEVFSTSVSDGTITRLTNRKGPDHSPVVSRDGKMIAWLGFDDRRLSYQVTKLYVMNRDGQQPRVIASGFDRSVASPVWSRDGKGLYFQFTDAGTTNIGYVTLDGKVSTLARHVGGVTIGRPYASGTFTTDGRGNFAYTHSQPNHPSDVAFGSKSSDKVRRLTRLNKDLFGQRQMASTKEFSFKSPTDGRRIQGWIVKPPEFDPAEEYPLILEIHGGPFANYGDRFSAEMQYYAAAGYVVVYINPAGSTGYGQKFANLIHHSYPGPDYDDLMAGVDAVIDRGYIDANNLFVTGGSGGGILTAWIVGKTNRFRAAVAAKPVINWYSFVLTSDAYPFFNSYWFPGVPWKHAEHYLRRSPISLVGNVTTPTMLMTGENDYRTPISESEQFYQALKLRKVKTALVRVPGASHAIVKRPSRLIAKVQHILKWFEMHRDTTPGK
jgi:acylaminoacyl-peptidase